MQKYEATMARAAERADELTKQGWDVDVLVIVSGHNSTERGCSTFSTTSDPLVKVGLCSLGLHTAIGVNSGNDE